MSYIDIINTKIGSNNTKRFSNGNVYPIVSLPNGMANWTLQTNSENGNWFYNPRDKSFEGIRLTHQPSPWVGDYGHIIFMPCNELKEKAFERWSSFNPVDTVIRPDYLKLYQFRYCCTVEVAPSERGGMIKSTFKNSKNAMLNILPFEFESDFNADKNTVYGFTKSQSVWNFKNLTEYFYITFNEKITSIKKLQNGGISIGFNSKTITAKIATSFISLEQAKQNYKSELEGKTFGNLKLLAEHEWENIFKLIEVSDENKEMQKTFYSCMYRMFLYPRKFYEISESGKIIHYNPDTCKVHNGFFYTDNGFWDTYRTVYPLLSIIKPDLLSEMIEGFVNFYEETGYLPKWISPGEFGLMPGTLIEAVIADAAVKGVIKGELLERAYKGLLKNAYVQSGNSKQGRIGCNDYIKYGYIPREKYKESVNHTLDCAYGDFCIAQVVSLLGDQEKAEELYERSKNYLNIFDKSVGFMRGKDSDGNMEKDFDPFYWGGEYCEGSAWQNSFGVYHDIKGLADAFGGEKYLEDKLDQLFKTSPIFNVGDYGNELHEMSEMALAPFGQCAISNQPSFHIPYIYSLLNRKDKTIYWIEKLVKEGFSYNDEGFAGDEDNGTMAAWYIFSCLGFYPLCPGKTEYVLSKPLFNEIKIKGKKLRFFSGIIIKHNEILQ